MPQQHTYVELVPRFLRLMSDIRKHCEDDPSVLYDDAKKDEPLRKLCVELHRVAEELKRHERSAEGGLIAPVNKTFRDELAVYEKEWELPISKASSYDCDPELALDFDKILGDQKIGSVYDDGNEREISEKEKTQLRYYLKELKNVLDELEEESDAREFVRSLGKTLVKLWKTASFNLQGAEERANLAPTLLVPPKIANKITPDGRLSLYRYWNEARAAYILGASMASMAMARATLEMLLRDVHKAESQNLESKIQYMKKNSQLSGDVMHRIQKIGDTILHGLTDTPSISGRKATENPTREALQVLRDLKTLIETS